MSKVQHEDFQDYVAARGSALLLRTAVVLADDRAEAETSCGLRWPKPTSPGTVSMIAAPLPVMYGAMVNTPISWWRGRKLEIYPTDELPDRPVDDHTGRSELHDALGRALGRLPKRQRLAVMLRYYEDMSESEPAKVLGISVGTVKSTVSRAMAKLRDDTELEHDFSSVVL
jgi:RNA polymerase sigma factor (sigma-70 family)